MATKKWYTSKLILVGIAEAAIGAYVAIVEGGAQTPFSIGAIIAGAVTIICRLITTKAVTK